MADKIRDTQAKLNERYDEQVKKGDNILKTDPSLSTKLNEFKRLLRDMSVDLKKRKELNRLVLVLAKWKN